MSGGANSRLTAPPGKRQGLSPLASHLFRFLRIEIPRLL
jgi:hypothetical protein